jgi:hypothetical protein
MRESGVGWLTQMGRARRISIDFWSLGYLECASALKVISQASKTLTLFSLRVESLSLQLHIRLDSVDVDIHFLFQTTTHIIIKAYTTIVFWGLS